MRIDLTDIMDHSGAKRNYEVPLEMNVYHMSDGDYPIKDSTPISVEIENRGDKKLSIKIQCDLIIDIPCARCLDEVGTGFEIRRELEADMKLTGEELENMLDEAGCIEGKELDLEVLVYNEILSRWPLRVLCSEDCKGLCPQCGANLNRTSCNCDTGPRDPRMAAISDIFSKFKEV